MSPDIQKFLNNQDNDFVCPICFNLIREAHMTRCGHTFCYECIIKCFETSSRCPKCNFDLENRESDIYPNFLLNELVAKHKSKLDKVARANAGSNPRWDIFLMILRKLMTFHVVYETLEIIDNEYKPKTKLCNQKPFYEAKCLFSRGHFTSLEYCHTSAHPKTFAH